MGVSVAPPVENTALPESQPSPRVHQERLHHSHNTLPEFNKRMEDSEEEEQQEEEEQGSKEFNVIPPYLEKDTNIDSGSKGSQHGAAFRPLPELLLILLLPGFILQLDYW